MERFHISTSKISTISKGEIADGLPTKDRNKTMIFILTTAQQN